MRTGEMISQQWTLEAQELEKHLRKLNSEQKRQHIHSELGPDVDRWLRRLSDGKKMIEDIHSELSVRLKCEFRVHGVFRVNGNDNTVTNQSERKRQWCHRSRK